jgi:hypothetical protein
MIIAVITNHSSPDRTGQGRAPGSHFAVHPDSKGWGGCAVWWDLSFQMSRLRSSVCSNTLDGLLPGLLPATQLAVLAMHSRKWGFHQQNWRTTKARWTYDLRGVVAISETLALGSAVSQWSSPWASCWRITVLFKIRIIPLHEKR